MRRRSTRGCGAATAIDSKNPEAMSAGHDSILFVLAYRISSSTLEEREAAILEFRAGAAEARRVAIRCARAVIELERTGAHYREGASSIAHFGEMNGVSAWEARLWVNLSLAIAPRIPDPSTSDEPPSPFPLARLEASLGPCLEAQVIAGEISVASAAILGEIVAVQMARPSSSTPIVRPDDQWVHLAKTKSTKELRRLFLQRRDEARAGQDVAPITAYVTNGVREDIDRARALVSRNAHQVLTLGQMLGIVVGDWLDDNDPMRTSPGTRRLPDTATIPGSRYVPAEVARQVRARSRDCCVVPFCDRCLWVHGSHRVAHRDGGSREADQLDLLCDWHHFLYEEGSLRITGPTDSPTITDKYGRPINERKPWEFGIAEPPPDAQKTPGVEKPRTPTPIDAPPNSSGDPPASSPPHAVPPTLSEEPRHQPPHTPNVNASVEITDEEYRQLCIPRPPAAGG